MSEMVVDVSLVSDEDVGDGSNLVGETILSNTAKIITISDKSCGALGTK